MASSHYYGYVQGFCDRFSFAQRWNVDNRISGGTPVIPTGNRGTVVPLINPAFQKAKDSAGVIMFDASSHTCRETLLGYMSDIYNSVYGVASFNGFSAMVHYMHEDGDPLTTDHIEEMLRFHNIFFGETSETEFWLERAEKTVKLYGKCTFANYQAILLKLSLILWIFRNRGILRQVLDNFESKGHRSSMVYLWQYLTEQFLNNLNWGDSYNGVLAMSLFCFTANTGIGYRTIESGPSTAVVYIPPSILMRYILEVYSTKFPQDVRVRGELRTGTPSSITTAIDGVLKLIQARNELDELKRKESK